MSVLVTYEGSSPSACTKIMSTPDVINGCFELFGAAAVWRNVAALWKDKQFKGTRIEPNLFFLVWGLWNLYYYPHLGQVLSLIGGIAMVTACFVYTCQLVYYRKR